MRLRRRSTPPESVPLPGLEPVSREFGFDRGGPVDRWYIERFLDAHRADVRGRVLEVAESSYTDRYGDGQVTQSDVLYAKPGLPEATIVGDLTTGNGIPRDAYDCLIVTQTLPFIYDVAGAVRGIRDALVEGGVALVTVPGISQISRVDQREWGDWWRFTSQGTRRLFADCSATARSSTFRRTATCSARARSCTATARRSSATSSCATTTPSTS